MSYQSYEQKNDANQGPERLQALRSAMESAGINAYLVPHGDEYQNEFLPEGSERLAWLTGFTGSAGFAVVTRNDAIVFVDGRYTLQASEQVNKDHFTCQDIVALPPSRWLKENLDEGAVVGFDPWVLTVNEHSRLQKSAQASSGTLKAVDNLIDQIWNDQPAVPLESVAIHEIEHAGKLARDKIEELQSNLRIKFSNYCLITDPTSICWLFNIRGGDVPHTPLTLARAILPVKGYPLLFIDKRKLPRETEAYLNQLADLQPPTSMDEELAKVSRDGKILLDPNSTPFALSRVVEDSGGKIVRGIDPVVSARAVKNETEIEGARNAHLRDGVAITKFLYWLDQQRPASQSEISAAKKLEEIRIENARAHGSELLEISFDTISGAGPNSAIPHYRVLEETNRTIEADSIYLVDSGGQYIDGTTDITRTIVIGTPPDGVIQDFTLVLKGHINIALARFPKGTRGRDIDILARNALWREGKDFAHGTGHGVGSYLSVHEGPQRISKIGRASCRERV